MSSCLICGEQGHKSSRCKSIGIPPEGFFTGGNGGGSHDHDDDEKATTNVSMKYYMPFCSMDDEFPSIPPMQVAHYHVFPNRLSNGVAQEA